MAELDAALQGESGFAPTGSAAVCTTLRLGVDQRKDALGGGQAILELAPEGGDARAAATRRSRPPA